jgi:RNA polymerase sigma factor (sigma-70 family)
VLTADLAALLEENMPVVEGVIADIARRLRVRGDALAEFRSLAFMKLVEHDYAVLRRFQGISSLRTYLTVVLQRVLLDYRNREWGRWRASAAAHRLGPTAVRLERLVTRDGLTPGEAVAAVGAGTDLSSCARFVETLRGRAPVRGSRSTLGEDAIPDCFDPSPNPEALADRRDQEKRATAMRSGVRDALQALDSEDHLIITLRFKDGLAVADVARVLGLEAKPLYRRINRILADLQAALSSDDRGQIARELAGDAWSDVTPGESDWWRPSNGLSGPAHPTTPDDAAPEGEVSGRRAARRIHRQLGSEPELERAAASL